MKNASASNTNSQHPPLARDAQGHPVALPEGAAWWGVKRHTGGRPKAIVGPDRKAVRLPLDTSGDEVLDMFGPGVYRFDALDTYGNFLDHVTTLELGGDDQDDDDPTPAPIVGGGARGASSDLRFALETIMQMARAQSESLRAVSHAQADYVKGLASAKALPRNVHYMPPLPPPAAPAPDDDDEEDDEIEDDDAQEAEAPGWMQVVADLLPTIRNVAEMYKSMTAPPTVPPPAAQPPPPAPPPTTAAARNGSAPPDGGRRNPMRHLAEINARLTGLERKYLTFALCSKHAGRSEELSEILLGLGVEEAVELVRQQVADAEAARRAARAAAQALDDEARGVDADAGAGAAAAPERAPHTEHGATDFMAHVTAVSAHLAAEERAAVLWLLPRFPADRIEGLKVQLLRMAPEQAAAWIRDNLPRLRAEVGS